VAHFFDFPSFSRLGKHWGGVLRAVTRHKRGACAREREGRTIQLSFVLGATFIAQNTGIILECFSQKSYINVVSHVAPSATPLPLLILLPLFLGQKLRSWTLHQDGLRSTRRFSMHYLVFLWSIGHWYCLCSKVCSNLSLLTRNIDECNIFPVFISDSKIF